MSHQHSPATPRQAGNRERDWNAWAFAALQRGLPTRAASKLVHHITQSHSPALKKRLIASFSRHFDVNLSEAEREDPQDYFSFNDFFTRSLKLSARPLDSDPAAFVSPVDGTVSQHAKMQAGRILQAKGRDFSAAELLAASAAAKRFEDGMFCTIYLAPSDYHRIHMPCDGRLVEWVYVPGRLFSVNPATTRHVPRLFARNERLIAHFETRFGPLALVMVGALFVGSLETVWAGRVSPPHRRSGGPRCHTVDSPVDYQRGQEIGRFNMGSTVILLTAKGALDWKPDITAGHKLQMGQALAQIAKAPA